MPPFAPPDPPPPGPPSTTTGGQGATLLEVTVPLLDKQYEIVKRQVKKKK